MRIFSFKLNRVLSLLLILMIHVDMTAQSTSKNYLQTKTYLDDSGLTFLRHIDYYDELGYVAETVDVGCNTSQTPILTRTDYTMHLKPSLQWAPAPVTGLDFLNKWDALAAVRATYTDNLAYTENEYDDFQELTSTRKPGDAWEEHPVTITRYVVPAGVVRKYSVNADGSLSVNGTYPYGLLTSTTTTDEDSLVMTVYTDVHGNTILERRGADNDTYYVYDDYGRLSYVLPPMCQQCNTSEFSKYWYKYTYDDRGRCTEKQLPGCSVVKYWYDEANRIQSEQDGHLRSQSLYRNFKYDAIGRMTLQTVSSTRGEASQSDATAVEVKNFYDNYSCRNELWPLFSVWADSINVAQLSPVLAKGKLTATLHTTGDGQRYFEIYGYDTDGRMKYKLSAYGDKWLKAVHTTYNFIGDVVSVNENVYKHGAYYVKTVLAKRRTVNTYHSGTRLLANTTVTQIDKNGNTSTQTISSPTYDVFGNVTADNRPGTAADMTYTHDILHGWLTGVSSPCGFSEQLQRETATNALYSGNIGSMQWRNTSNGELHQYDYSYDSLGRLTGSQYSSSVSGTDGRFDESVTYNANGSILTLLRNGMKNNGTFGYIDSLAITYDGNRLLKVTDYAEALNYNGALDFHDGENTASEYAYDNNGALTRDGNRGIKSITYDYSHYPSYINMSIGKKTRYVDNDYTPDGRKLLSLQKITISNGGGITRITTTDTYIDGLILRGDTTLLWQFGGGYVDLNANGTPTGWNYYVTDHLGSTRMVVDSNDSIKETINYYPFGSEMRMENPALLNSDYWQRFRFTGKELVKTNDLNMYDFGARWYDVAGVPMWTSIDPLAEKYYNVSPYAYCGGNPVNAIDPNGCDTINVSFEDERWNVDNPTMAEGDDVFNVTINGETKSYTFSEGEYGNRMNILVLEDDKKTESFGVYNLSGKNIVGYALQPEGPESPSCDNIRIPVGSYSTFIGGGERWNSYIGLHGNLQSEGVRVHYGTSRIWSKSCIIISSNYYVENGSKRFDLNQSREAVWNYVQYLGAISRKEKVPMPAKQNKRYRDKYTYSSNNRVNESRINIMNL